MSLIILEGLDRTGKSTVAEYFAKQGYEIIHMSAPAKGISADQYMEEMVGIVSSAASRDIVLDRSYYGELVWPQVYERDPLLIEDDFDYLREIEKSVGTTRILMYDPDVAANWKRCVADKEPLDRKQFKKASDLFLSCADKYGFEKKTLKDYANLPVVEKVVSVAEQQTQTDEPVVLKKTVGQSKLERANAINRVLSKRILKQSGPVYERLEQEIRGFLEGELAKVFGEDRPQGPFTDKEMVLLKLFCKRMEEKQ